ncbi:MAG: hypothetical protein IPN42_16900 [Methylococcaceae bacterium]|nr:hypothetical protein [Methylococcaceae bacterium]
MINSHYALQSFKSVQTDYKIDKRNAYYLAGQAAAIYFGNKKKQLPAVFFQIFSKSSTSLVDSSGYSSLPVKACNARLIGGRLIQNLTLPYEEATRYFDGNQREQFLSAFEADIANLMVGSLAAAKYVFMHYDEKFAANSLHLDTLYLYGDQPDLDLISEYIECLIPNKTEQEQKLTEIFLTAYRFVNLESNWDAITTLADFIDSVSKEVISCEQIIAVLESVA